MSLDLDPFRVGALAHLVTSSWLYLYLFNKVLWCLTYVTPVTRTRKYGGKHKDTLVVAHLNLTGSLSYKGTFDTRHAAAYISTSVSINNNNGNFLLSI